MPERSVQTLQPILQTIMIIFLFILSAVTPPKMPNIANVTVKAGPEITP